MGLGGKECNEMGWTRIIGKVTGGKWSGFDKMTRESIGMECDFTEEID